MCAAVVEERDKVRRTCDGDRHGGEGSGRGRWSLPDCCRAEVDFGRRRRRDRGKNQK